MDIEPGGEYCGTLTLEGGLVFGPMASHAEALAMRERVIEKARARAKKHRAKKKAAAPKVEEAAPQPKAPETPTPNTVPAKCLEFLNATRECAWKVPPEALEGQAFKTFVKVWTDSAFRYECARMASDVTGMRAAHLECWMQGRLFWKALANEQRARCPCCNSHPHAYHNEGIF